MHFSKLAADVIAFHEKFNLLPISKGGKPEFKLRFDRLLEELTEIDDAIKADKKGDFLDALVDTVYIAVGTLYLYDNTDWFNNKFDYPVQLGMEPCSWMHNFKTADLMSYVKNDEQSHCHWLPSLVNNILVWAANNNWPFDAAWDEVQKANMAKERAKSDASNSKHKSSQDIVKPAGWQSPDIDKIVEWHKNTGAKI